MASGIIHPNFAEICDWLRQFGARSADVVDLEHAEPEEQIRYLDLIRVPERERQAIWPRAVVEVESQPALYVVPAPMGHAFDEPQIVHLCRILAFRAGAEYLGLLEPGRITVYPITLAKGAQPQPRPTPAGDPLAEALIPALAFPSLDEYDKDRPPTAMAVHKLLYRLLTRTTDALINAGVEELDALSLVGRALFVRFLGDRDVLRDEDVREICGVSIKDCFSEPRHAARMSQWLDRTFNGDFLPLTRRGARAWFDELADKVFDDLSNVLHRATPEGQLHLEWGAKWHDLQFDHIPVGLLSQVYEQHAHRFDPVQAKATSVHYTPRHVAEYMVDEVFYSMGGNASRARVLDPAVGGGVFLVAAFRRLAAERWRADGKPPTTKVLRQILYKQLTGFDISEHALRLCSLGLYLTAIELDTQPRPPGRLRFDTPLFGTVLHNVRPPDARHGYIGSLSARTVGPEHRGKYDVVIGNPPWTPWKATGGVSKAALLEQVEEVEHTIRAIVENHLDDGEAVRYSMTGKAPDLPFFWRAMEWARPGGWIALAMRERIVFKQTPSGRRDRNALSRAVRITGILNGTNVRDTSFWPQVRAPFCLIFARNERPDANAAFHFVSPELEKGLNDRGRLRIDSASARRVRLADLRARPALLKALSRGTMLDVNVITYIESRGLPSLGTYWRDQGWEKLMGLGFKVGAEADEAQPAKDLWELPELTSECATSYFINGAMLPRVSRGRALARPRERSIYTQPLVLIRETPPVDERRKDAHLALEDIAYNRSFIGISCARHDDPELLARYLFLLFNSRFPLYWTLLTSGKFGIERDVFLVEDIKRVPFRPLEDLPDSAMADIRSLSQSLLDSESDALERVRRWVVSSVYQLGDADSDVIRDTLKVGLPFAESRRYAQERPGTEEMVAYMRSLVGVLESSLERYDRRLTTKILHDGSQGPWMVVRLDTHPGRRKRLPQQAPIPLSHILEKADSLSASHIVVTSPPSTLVIATVAQQRFLTPSRARLTALELIHEHADILLGKAT
jgi:hypothetical protein